MLDADTLAEKLRPTLIAEFDKAFIKGVRAGMMVGSVLTLLTYALVLAVYG